VLEKDVSHSRGVLSLSGKEKRVEGYFEGLRKATTLPRRNPPSPKGGGEVLHRHKVRLKKRGSFGEETLPL